MILYTHRGIRREKPNVGAIIRKVTQAGGESDGGRCTPCNVVNARMNGNEDAI
jgi:hypothetical protein